MRYSGIYLHFEGTTAECDAEQVARESVFDTDSGLFRYMDALSGVHYLNASDFDFSGYWQAAYSDSIYWYSSSNFSEIRVGSPSDLYSIKVIRDVANSISQVATSGILSICGSTILFHTNSGAVAECYGNKMSIYPNKYLLFGNSYVGWDMYADVADNLYISGLSYTSFNLKSYLGLNLLNYSGDTNISGLAGNTYIKQNGNGSTTGNITLNASGNLLGYGNWVRFQSTSYAHFMSTDSDLNFTALNGAISICGKNNIVIDSTNGDVYSTPWQSYSITDPSGWASITFSSVQYKTIGDLVFLSYYVSGNANSDQVAEIDLPYSPNNYLDTCHVASVADSGNYGFGKAQVLIGTNRLSVSNDQEPSPTWATGGVKLIHGQFWYQKA